MVEEKDNRMYESDLNFKYLLGSRLTMIDMTDYEYNFCGANEVGNIPLFTMGPLQLLKEEPTVDGY